MNTPRPFTPAELEYLEIVVDAAIRRLRHPDDWTQPRSEDVRDDFEALSSAYVKIAEQIPD